MQGNGDASLRPLNRLGWYLKVVDGAPLRAPLSAGVPTHDAGGRCFGPPRGGARIDEALGEAQQMLLHRYDRVLLPAELSGRRAAARCARSASTPTWWATCSGGWPRRSKPGGGKGGQ